MVHSKIMFTVQIVDLEMKHTTRRFFLDIFVLFFLKPYSENRLATVVSLRQIIFIFLLNILPVCYLLPVGSTLSIFVQ